MSLCASCGLHLFRDEALCPHHHNIYGDDWSASNRIMCDFFHRRKVLPRVSLEERETDFWPPREEVAPDPIDAA